MSPIRYAIAGSGWRAEFFLRVACALPERFQVTGVLARRPARGEQMEKSYRVRTVRTLDDLVRTGPEFVVVAVPWDVNPGLLADLAGRGIPALSETPPGPSLDDLAEVARLVKQGARIQVAEQYHSQPAHAARIHVAASGLLGQVTQAQVSAAHGYHGVSLIRRLLGIGMEDAAITAHRFDSPIVASPGRSGPPEEERLDTSSQVIAWLDFGGRLGIFDFTGDQYFSYIRSPRMLVRGSRGEINNFQVRWLQDFCTPITAELRREDAGQDGNLEGYYHKGYLLGSEWAYQSPFIPARLSDDEIAIASCLQGMAAYAAGGPDFYSVAEAAQDHYLGMMIDRSAATGEAIRTSQQAW